MFILADNPQGFLRLSAFKLDAVHPFSKFRTFDVYISREDGACNPPHLS